MGDIPGNINFNFPQNKWTNLTKTHDWINTTHGPALAEYDGKLYMVYKGSNTDQYMWSSSSEDGVIWSAPVRLPNPGHQTTDRPALAVYKAAVHKTPFTTVYETRLYLAWIKPVSGEVMLSYFNGSKWSDPKETGVTVTSTHGPALAVIDDRLYMAWKEHGSARVMFSYFNGTKWSDPKETGGNSTHGPALATSTTISGGKRLHLAYKGSGNDKGIWYTYYSPTGDGSVGNWNKPIKNIFPSAEGTSCGPAIATYSKYWDFADSYDPIHKDLYLIWKDGANNSTNEASYKLREIKEEWTPRNLNLLIQTSDTPALAVYKDRLYVAWKEAAGSKIYFSYRNTGPVNHQRNIFEKTRPGTPVVRQEDLAVFRVETRNMKIVQRAVISVSPGYANPGASKIKENARILLLDSLLGVKNSKISTLIKTKAPVRIDALAVQLKDAGAEVVFCQDRIDDETLKSLAKEGIEVIHSVSEAEMKELTLATGAVVSSMAKLSRNSLGIAASVEVLGSKLDRAVIIARATKPQLQKSGDGDAYLILHLPPQSFGEQAFFKTNPANDGFTDTPLPPPKEEPSSGTEACDPPVRARIAHESRLVFKVPDNFGDIEYTLAGVLEACKKLPLIVSTANKPELPGKATTSIEMPWRLIISPKLGAYWRHASLPVESGSTKHTELWHTRMVTPKFEGGKITEEIMSPYPDTRRITRAIWALSGIGNEAAVDKDHNLVPMKSEYPKGFPKPDVNPFRATLDNFDRYQLAHLTSSHLPLETNTMMLSPLGGWLDARGAWDTPGFSVEQWSHRATMGRDHFVRVVYRGFLVPFGHRVSLIKVSERKFNNTKSGDYAAYLHQRMYLVINEKERTFNGYDDYFQNATKINNEPGYLARKFPFKSVKLLTEITPDLCSPDSDPSRIRDENGNSMGQLMFWPHVETSKPFRFQCVAIDLEGRRILFDLPMIFVDSTQALPRNEDESTPDYSVANTNTQTAIKAFSGKGSEYNTADFAYQRMALAKNRKPGDTSAQVKKMRFGGFSENNTSLRDFSKKLTRPMWVPQIEEVEARIESISNLSGAQGTHRLTFNETYLKYDLGADTNNKGEVFVDIVPGFGPILDFSAQGDKSGGFIQPNLKPAALSRLSGPVMGNVAQLTDFINGTMSKGAGFPVSDTDLSGMPNPLLFGCIPLGAIIVGAKVSDLKRLPKFISETGNVVDTFISDLGRLLDLVNDVPRQALSIAAGALIVFNETLKDLLEQSSAYNLQQMSPVVSAINQIIIKHNTANNKLTALLNQSNQPDLGSLLTGIGHGGCVQAADGLRDAANDASLPAGFKQSVSNAALKISQFLEQIEALQQLAGSRTALNNALYDIVGTPQNTASMLSKPAVLNAKLITLKTQLDSFSGKLKKTELLDGAPRNTMLSALAAIGKLLEEPKLVEMLTGDELTVRFDWNPEITNWALPGSTDPIFRANDKNGLLVAVEAKVKKNGMSSSKISVNCSLKHFDLVLIAPKSFIELNFEKIEFSIDSAAKTDVDVKLSNIKFLGVLSFVETLRDLIPLDGFSDPPYLDITPKGIDAGYSISLPSICCGMLNIANLSLSAGFTVPFIGEPMSVRFNFCRREQPFLLTVYGLGGGGFFGITIDPHGVQILEASLEFGASVGIDFGVAKGEVHIMAGMYFRMEKDEASLTGYFRMGGSLRVLALITASVELYLGLTYEFSSGKCVGRAQLTIEVSVLFFHTHVTIEAERKIAGSNGDPTFRQMLGFRSDVTLGEELELINAKSTYPWREYVEAFADEEV